MYTIHKLIIEGLKTATRKFMTVFYDATINKKCFLIFWFNKNDKNIHILFFVQLHVFIENEPKVVTFIARKVVCFMRLK